MQPSMQQSSDWTGLLAGASAASAAVQTDRRTAAHSSITDSLTTVQIIALNWRRRAPAQFFRALFLLICVSSWRGMIIGGRPAIHQTVHHIVASMTFATAANDSQWCSSTPKNLVCNEYTQLNHSDIGHRPYRPQVGNMWTTFFFYISAQVYVSS